MKILYIALIGGGAFALIWLNKIRIYLKWEKKKKEYEAPFFRWWKCVHDEPKQKELLRQAKEEKFLIQYQDKKKGLCRIKADSDPEIYWCNLGMCQCPEYKSTHKPCKHIYKIALEKGLIQ